MLSQQYDTALASGYNSSYELEFSIVGPTPASVIGSIIVHWITLTFYWSKVLLGQDLFQQNCMQKTHKLRQIGQPRKYDNESH